MFSYCKITYPLLTIQKNLELKWGKKINELITQRLKPTEEDIQGFELPLDFYDLHGPRGIEWGRRSPQEL